MIFSYVAKDLTLVPKRILPPRALIVALSPLVDERFVKALQDLLARGFEDLRRQGITVVEWHPEEPLEMVLAATTQRRRMRRVAR